MNWRWNSSMEHAVSILHRISPIFLGSSPAVSSQLHLSNISVVHFLTFSPSYCFNSIFWISCLRAIKVRSKSDWASGTMSFHKIGQFIWVLEYLTRVHWKVVSRLFIRKHSDQSKFWTSEGSLKVAVWSLISCKENIIWWVVTLCNAPWGSVNIKMPPNPHSSRWWSTSAPKLFREYSVSLNPLSLVSNPSTACLHTFSSLSGSLGW